MLQIFATSLDEAVSQKLLPELEVFDSPISAENQNSVISIVFPEFTCLCPKTGYPDFASIELYYVPGKSCVELKSWKLYLNSFRMIGTFHESVTHFLFEELKRILDPRWLMVVGDFFPRGNVNTTVVIETDGDRPRCADALIQRQRVHIRSFE